MRQALLVAAATVVFTGVAGFVAYSYAAEASAAGDGEAVAADQSTPSCRSHECGDCAGTCCDEECFGGESTVRAARCDSACSGHIEGERTRGRCHAVTAGVEASR